MVLTAREKQVMVAINILQARNEKTTEEEVESFGRMFFCSYKLNWDKAFPALLAKGMIRQNNGQFDIVEEFKDLAGDLAKKYPRFRYWYNDWYRLASQSEAHSRLCQKAYGVDLCQTGMMTLHQIQYLISNFVRDDHVCLDLGCGIGCISEYIADEASCRMTGIDPIVSGIRLARRRTVSKKDYLRFELGDMITYFTPEKKYDIIFLLDTIYFLGGDFSKVIPDAIKTLKPKGKIFVFYSAWDPKDSSLEGNSTQLGGYLRKEGILYQTVDFTEDERVHWELKHQTLLQLKEYFLEERNEMIFTNRLTETEHFTKLAGESKLFRYLYIIN